MLLTVERFFSDEEATIGVFKVDGKFRCFTLEDEFRSVKVMGETRIPAGLYDVQLRKEGGFHNRYKNHPRIGAVHKGMLHLQNVPGFDYILFHCGNTDEDTAGCVLVGFNGLTEKGVTPRVGRSVDAYLSFYPEIAAVLEAGGNVTVEIIDRDR